MKRALCLFAAIVATAGCKSKVDDGYAIDFSLVVDSTVSDQLLATAQTLDFEITGGETYSNAQISIVGKLGPSRTAGVRYKPKATSGTIDAQMTLLDASGTAIAAGSLSSIRLGGGTQTVTLTLSQVASANDGGVDMLAGDMTMCGNGVVDPGEQCDPGAGSATPCPTSASDCDDKNPCTTDSMTGSGCQAACMHVPLANGTGCTSGTATGVCQAGSCCTGCIQNGVCLAGTTDAKNCGSGGNSCFDCTQNSATATCNGGNCSGCDATSCTTEGRTCGTSSCGYNCGGCPDGCSNGNLTHYACVNKSCQMNGSGNCGLYAACATSSTCATSCTGDNGCVATAWCGSNVCKPKVALGGACSAEGTGDHECSSPYVCSWGHDGVVAYCTASRCTACAAAYTDGSCGSVIDQNKDPRSYCAYVNTCQNGTCSGLCATCCDQGYGTQLYWRTCGAVSCTNGAGGVGQLSGSICSMSSTNSTCITTTEACTDQNQTCWPCNSAGTDCNYGAPFQCN